MARVDMNTRINASAGEVWDVLRDFNGLPAFIAGITKSSLEGEGVGAVRTLTLQGGGPPILEKLESLNDTERTLSYSIVTSPLPVQAYFSTVELKEAGVGRCDLRWHSTFTPRGASEAEAVKAIEGVYSAAFDGLKKLFG